MKTKILTWFLDIIRKTSSITFLRRMAIIIFVLVVLIASGPWISNSFAQILYSQKQYSNAAKIWTLGANLSLQEKDIMLANAGNALYKQKELNEAVNQYDKALTSAPASRQCKIRWNMSVALTTIGETQEISNPNDAIGTYSRALFQLTYVPCLEKSEYKDTWQKKIKDLQARIARLNANIKEKTKKIKYEPDFEKPTEEKRAEKRQEVRSRAQESKNSDKYNKQDTEDRMKSYEGVW